MPLTSQTSKTKCMQDSVHIYFPTASDELELIEACIIDIMAPLSPSVLEESTSNDACLYAVGNTSEVHNTRTTDTTSLVVHMCLSTCTVKCTGLKTVLVWSSFFVGRCPAWLLVSTLKGMTPVSYTHLTLPTRRTV